MVLILPAFALGYVLPAVLMALASPGIVSNEFQQLPLVSWNLFPLLVLGLIKLFAAVIPVLSRQPIKMSASSPQEHVRAVRFISAASLFVSAAVHIGVLAVSFSTRWFPALFEEKHGKDLSLASLSLLPMSISPGETVRHGVRSFFLWDQVAGLSYHDSSNDVAASHRCHFSRVIS